MLIERWRNKRSSEDEDEMKIIPPLRNSESKASGNKRSSKDPDDQIWDSNMIDGESSKAELLQSSKCSSEILLQLFLW